MKKKDAETAIYLLSRALSAHEMFLLSRAEVPQAKGGLRYT